MAPRVQKTFISKWNLPILTVWCPHLWLVILVSGDNEEGSAEVTWPGGSGPAPPLALCIRVYTCLSKNPLPSGSAKSHICGNTKMLVSATADHCPFNHKTEATIATCGPYVYATAATDSEQVNSLHPSLPPGAHSGQWQSPENTQVHLAPRPT